jgi:hypothetical protein
LRGFKRFFAAALLLPAANARAQKTAVISVNLATRSAELIKAGQSAGTAIHDGDEIRIRWDQRIPIRLIGMNTALFTCSVTQEKVSVPELDSLKSAFTAFGPYLPELASAIAESNRPGVRQNVQGLPPEGTSLSFALVDSIENQLSALDELIHGDDGLGATRMRALQTLDLMHRRPFAVDSNHLKLLRSSVDNRCHDSTCTHLKFPAEIDALTRPLVKSRTLLEKQRLAALKRHRREESKIPGLEASVERVGEEADRARAEVDSAKKALEAAKPADRAAAAARVARATAARGEKESTRRNAVQMLKEGKGTVNTLAHFIDNAKTAIDAVAAALKDTDDLLPRRTSSRR